MNVMDISNCRSCCRCRCRRCCCCCRPSRKTNVYLLHIFLFIMIACCCCCCRCCRSTRSRQFDCTNNTAHEKYSMALDFHAIDVIDLNFIVNHNVLVVRFFSPKIAVRSENVARSTAQIAITKWLTYVTEFSFDCFYRQIN